MIIEKLYIDKFAGLSDFTLEPSAGLNIIEGKNESGKSTVAAFLKFVFYGLSGQKTGGEELSERARALPYCGAYAGGSLDVRTADRRLRIERVVSVTRSGTRESARDEVKITDLDTGEKLDGTGEPGEYFFGVSQKVFCSTAFFRQLADSAPDAGDISAAIGNILFSGDESTDADKAAQRLDKLRTALRHKRGSGGELAELEEKAAELKNRLQAAENANIGIIETDGELEARRGKYALQTKRFEAESRRLEAATICRQLRLRKEKAEADECADRAGDTLRALSAAGNMPTEGDISAARTDLARLDVRRESAIKAKETEDNIHRELAGLEKEPELNRKISALGGTGAVRTAFEAAKKRRRTFTLLAVFLALPGAGSSAFGVYAMLQNKFRAASLPAAAAGILLLVCAGAMLVLMLRARAAARKICAELGCGAGGEELETRLEALDEANRRAETLRAALSAAEQARQGEERACAALEEASGKLAARLSRLAAECSDAASALRTAISDAEKRLSDAVRLRSEYTAARQRSAELSGLMTEESGEELQQRLDALGVADPYEINIENAGKNVEFYRRQMDILQSEIHSRELRLTELKARAEDPVTLSGRLYELMTEYDEKERLFRAYEKAGIALSEAAQELRSGVAPRLSDGARRRLAEVTDGRYAGLTVNAEISAALDDGQSVRSLEYLSAGTRDLAYISLRLALVGLLYTGEKPPLIFDESLAHQDAERTSRTLRLLSGEAKDGIQSLLFTCRSTERDSANGICARHISI